MIYSQIHERTDRKEICLDKQTTQWKLKRRVHERTNRIQRERERRREGERERERERERESNNKTRKKVGITSGELKDESCTKSRHTIDKLSKFFKINII